MENEKDKRWKQRFSEYKKSMAILSKALSIPSPDEIYRAGVIHLFEVAFELGCKTLKDYLEAEGHIISLPRSVIQQAFQAGIISQGHEWIDALEKRNLMAHTYDEKEVRVAEEKIRNSYFSFLNDLVNILKAKEQ
jgi:nucleotidyltransferase substrate binding protein (TIGR01987 family)